MQQEQVETDAKIVPVKSYDCAVSKSNLLRIGRLQILKKVSRLQYKCSVFLKQQANVSNKRPMAFKRSKGARYLLE